MKRKIWNFVWKSCSMTTMMFVFQACYGTWEDHGMDVHITGTVKSKDTRLPLAQVRVSVDSTFQYTETNERGEFSLYVASDSVYHICFSEAEGITEKRFQAKDTIIRDQEEHITLNLFLE